jgi:hypothetical protein
LAEAATGMMEDIEYKHVTRMGCGRHHLSRHR